eukprot:15435756-Alexandrium_andersonii.AAC.1
MVDRALAQHPSTPSKPWGMTTYSDEVSPGNQLLSDNPRKAQAIYYSFREFGAATLADEEAWSVERILRTCVTNTLLAGTS